MIRAGEPPMAQIHIRLTKDLSVRLRNMAIAEQEEITKLCADAIDVYVESWEYDRENADNEREDEDQRRTIGQENNVPTEDHRTEQQ